MSRSATNSGWLLSKLRKGQVWCALLSLSLGLSAATTVETVWRGAGGDTPELEDRALDSSFAESPSSEAEPPPSLVFYLALAGSFFAFYLALSLFNGWVVQGLLGEAMEKEKSGVLLLSQISLALYVLHLVAGEEVPIDLRTLTHLFAGLLLLSMAAKYLVAVGMRSDREWAVVWDLLNDDPLMLAGLFMPVVVISLAGLAAGVTHPLAGWPFSVAFAAYLVVLLGWVAGYALLARWIVGKSRDGAELALHELSESIVVAGAPLVLIPLGILISTEIQLTLNMTGFRVIGFAVIATLTAVSVALFVLQKRGRTDIGGAAILAGFYFPAAVATLASFKTHQQFLDLGILDYFRAGELSLPAQQWVEFGSVPLLDLLPSQGLAEFGVQWLYSLFHGVHDLDLLVWLPWIPVVVGFLIIYAFLALVSSPLLALLVTILLPIKAVVVGQYAVALLPAVVLVAALRRPDFRRFLTLWMILGLLLVWRPGLGWPAALAAVALVGAVVVLENRQVLAPATASLLLVLALVPAGILVAEIFWNGDTYAALVDYLGLLTDSGVRSYGAIAGGAGMNRVTSALALLLPVLTVICVLFFCLRKFLRRQDFAAPGYAVLYLLIFSVALPARSWGRLFDPSLLLLAIAMMPFFFIQRPFRPLQIGRSTWVLAVLVASAFLGSVDIYHLVGGTAADSQQSGWKPGDKRVLFNRRPHQTVVEYLSTQLAEEESFFDFTGSPVLYSLASKPYPLRRISSFRETSESRQRSQIASLDRHRLAGGLPLVVFQRPPQIQKGTTDLPTEAISYRIAEYVYSHYLPYASVGGWEVWRERGLKRGRPAPPAKIIGPRSIQQGFRLGHLPRRWAAEDPWHSVSKTDVVTGIVDQPVLLRAGAPVRLTWTSEKGSLAGTYLHVRARPLAHLAPRHAARIDPALTIRYGPEPQSSFEFRLAPWSPEDPDKPDPTNLRLRDDPKKHMLHRVARYPDRWVFRTTGRDAWLRQFVDLSPAPVLEAGMEQWITLQYRSRKGGRAQVFFAAEQQKFQESRSIELPLMAAGIEAAPRQVEFPVVGLATGSRLSQLRFDPPEDDEFEIVGVKLTHRSAQSKDYLVRLTTQFRWANGEFRQMTFESEVPVLIDRVSLRTGD